MTFIHQDTDAPSSDTSSTTTERSAETKNSSATPRLHHGVVRSVQMGRHFVVCADAAFYARVAASCLLQPQVGDRVLVSAIATESHVLAVLERADTQHAVVQVEGDVSLHLPRGALKVHAAEGVSMDAGPRFALRASSAALETQRLAIESQEIMMRANKMLSHAERRLDVAKHRHEIITRQHAEYGDSVRRVSGHDEQSARSARLVVERDWRVRAERGDILGRRRVKIDADQVDLG